MSLSMTKTTNFRSCSRLECKNYNDGSSQFSGKVEIVIETLDNCRHNGDAHFCEIVNNRRPNRSQPRKAKHSTSQVLALG